MGSLTRLSGDSGYTPVTHGTVHGTSLPQTPLPKLIDGVHGTDAILVLKCFTIG